MMIGLLGKSRVGKDTVAECLMQLMGEGNASLIRLSQPLKDATCLLYGFTPQQVEGPSKEIIVPELQMTPRQCIQKICTFLMKEHGEGFFSRRVFHQFDMNLVATNIVIIPDIRFANDISEIQKRGGLVIKITRNHEGVPQHVWEDGIDNMCGDVTIENNTSMEDLRKKVAQLYEERINRNVRNIVP